MMPNREKRVEPAFDSQAEVATGADATAAGATRRASWLARLLVWIFGAWVVVIALFLLLLTLTAPDAILRAVTGMALGLFLCWIVLCGALSLLLRNRMRSVFSRFDARW